MISTEQYEVFLEIQECLQKRRDFIQGEQVFPLVRRKDTIFIRWNIYTIVEDTSKLFDTHAVIIFWPDNYCYLVNQKFFTLDNILI